MKSRTHEVVVKLSFNRKVTRSAAVRAARNGIHGKLYASILEEYHDGWSTAKIGAVTSKSVSRKDCE